MKGLMKRRTRPRLPNEMELCIACQYEPGCEQCPKCGRCLLYCQCTDSEGIEP